MFHQQRGTRGGAVVVLGEEALAVQVDDDFPWLPVLRDQPARRAIARRVGCAERMIEHAAEIRQEFLVMHDAAPGAETEFQPARSEEHTSELQSLMRISYAVFCLKKKI